MDEGPVVNGTDFMLEEGGDVVDDASHDHGEGGAFAVASSTALIASSSVVSASNTVTEEGFPEFGE